MVAKVGHPSREADSPPLRLADGLTEEERSLYQRIPAEVRYVYHECFDSPTTDDSLLCERLSTEHPPAWAYRPDGSDGAEPEAKAFRLSAKEEAALFVQFNHARYRLAKLRQRHPAGLPSIAPVREMVSWFRKAQHLRAVLVRANMPLVLMMAKRYGPGDVEFSDLVSEGNLVLLRCVESFDASKGFKFSTYACRAIIKGFNRLAAATRRYRQRFPVEFDPDLERSDEAERRDRDYREGAIHALRDLLVGGRSGLRPVERRILIERFGITGSGKKKTLAHVSQLVGLSPERVRQLQHVALAKLRSALAGDAIPA